MRFFLPGEPAPVQMQREGGGVDIACAAQLLQGSNIAPDASWDPMQLDLEQGLYLVRGAAKGAGLPATEIAGVQVFPDTCAGPAGPTATQI